MARVHVLYHKLEVNFVRRGHRTSVHGAERNLDRAFLSKLDGVSDEVHENCSDG